MNDLNGVKKGFDRKEETFMFYSEQIYRSLPSSPVKHYQPSTSSDLNKFLSNSGKLNQKKQQQVKQAKMTPTNVRLFSLIATLITLLLNISAAKQTSGEFSSQFFSFSLEKTFFHKQNEVQWIE